MGQGQVGQAVEQRGQGHFGFQAGQVGAQAVVRAVAEGQVGLVGAGGVEGVGGVRMHGGVPAGGGEADDDRVAPGDGDSLAQVDVLDRVAHGEEHDRAVVAQGFLDDVVPVDGLRPEPVQVFGVGEQRVQGAGDQVHRGFVTGAEHEEERVEQFLTNGSGRAGGGAGGPVLRRGQEVGGHIEAGVLLLVVQQLVQSGLEFDLVGDCRGGVGRGVQDRVDRGTEGVAHAVGHAQQVADDRHGQRQGQRAADVDALPGRHRGDRVDQAIRGRLDLWPHPVHAARRERRGDVGASAAMVLAVSVDEALLERDRGEWPSGGYVGQSRPVPTEVAGDSGVERQRLDDAVPGDGPGLYAAREFDQHGRAPRAQRGGLRVCGSGGGVENGASMDGLCRHAWLPSRGTSGITAGPSGTW